MFERIRYFQEVVRQNSFSKAAEVCDLSQSAMSQQIAALERELGFLLLQRRHRSFTLTPAGEYFYRNSFQLLEDADRILREASHIAHPDQSVLRVGILRGAEPLCIPAIREFGTLYPQVRLELTFGSHEVLFQSLRRDACDLVINDQRRAFSDAYRNEILCRLPWRIDTDQAISGQTVAGNQLPRTVCLLLEDDEAEQAFYRDVLGLDGPFETVASEEEARILAAAGQGVFPCTGDESLPLLLKEGQPQMRVFCAFSKTWNRKGTLQAFIELLHKNIESMNPET